MKLNLKIIILILPVIVIGTLISTSSYISITRNALETTTFSKLITIADSKSLFLNLFVQSKQNRVLDFSTEWLVTKTLKNESSIEELNNHLINDMITVDSSILTIDVVNTNKTIISSTNNERIGLNTEVEETTLPFIGEVEQVDDITNFPISHTVKDDNKVIGYIKLLFNAEFIKTVTDNYYGLGETGENLLIEIKNGNKYYLNELRSDQETMFKTASIPDPSEFREVLEEDFKGTQVYRVYENLTSPGWLLVIQINKAEILGPLEFSSNTLLITSISLIFVIIASLLILLNLFIVKPIKELTEVMTDVSTGKMNVKLDIKSKDEIGNLQRAFDRLLTSLKLSMKEKEEEGR